VVVKWDEKRAIKEIDDAIHQVKEAAIDDGKDISEHEPVDRPTWGGRLQRSLELLGKARRRYLRGGGQPVEQVHGLRVYALEHIANAEKFVKEGMEDARTMKEPPRLHHRPITRRTSRAQRSAHGASAPRAARRDAEVKWDEKRAVGQIDAAIKEIREAAIDDGKPLNDHPPVDAKVRHRDRIKSAVDLLEKSAKDIEEREDNNFAKACAAAPSATSARRSGSPARPSKTASASNGSWAVDAPWIDAGGPQPATIHGAAAVPKKP